MPSTNRVSLRIEKDPMENISYLSWLAAETPTRWWHDSGDPDELSRALAQSACGVTTNPILTSQALRSKPEAWREVIGPLAPGLFGEEKAIALIQGVVGRTAARLEPQYAASKGEQGYVCAQVNPNKAGDRESMLAMAHRFHAWAPNIAVKLPVTAAGLDVLEECIAAGITVTATVSFSVPQALAVAERHRLGSQRARESGIQPGRCFGVIMIGRLDDYLREVVSDNRIAVSEAEVRQAGLAVVKRAYGLYLQQGYAAVLLVAALRGTYHMSGLAGGRLVMSVHPKIQALLSGPGVARENGIDQEIDARVIRDLRQIPDFARAYEPDGMKPEEFISFGLTQRTISSFIEAGWGMLESFNLF
jgi:transaldolase